jgi:two-component system sensor histidine kinase PilS (NtrC family)
VRGKIINFQDLTLVKQMEEMVKRTERLSSLGRMAASIAHEIRNPLASISGSLELLRSVSELDEDNRKLMDIALREIERLNGLVRSFLEYARPKPPRLEVLDLGLELRVMAAAIEELVAAPGAPRVSITSAESGLWVAVDRDQLQGVLWNLVRNAWEAGEQQEVALRARALPDGEVELAVTDSAAGIPDELLDQVFEPFFTTKDAGTGLGLAMVYRTIQDHGGELDIQSTEGHGTTIRILLPEAREPASVAG